MTEEEIDDLRTRLLASGVDAEEVAGTIATARKYARMASFVESKLPFESALAIMGSTCKHALFRKLEEGYVLCEKDDPGAVCWRDRVDHTVAGVQLTVTHWIKLA